MTRTLRQASLALLLAASLALCAVSAVQLWQGQQQRTLISALAAGQDIKVDQDAPAPVLAARARFLLAHGNLEAAQAIADRLGSTPAEHATTLYALGNSHLRAALNIFTQVPFRVVRPTIALAKAEYRQAIQLDPQNWDARYNYALAAALVRDTEGSTPSSGDQMAHERAAWPDIPGAPNGMP